MNDFASSAHLPDQLHVVEADVACDPQPSVTDPQAIIVMSLLAMMATSCQVKRGVRLPADSGRLSSQTPLTIAELGERKTTVDRVVRASADDHNERMTINEVLA